MSEPGKQDPPKDPDDETEKAFWSKLGKLIDDRVDAGIGRAIEKYRVTGSSRNGGRTTLPGIMADLMFGKPPAKKE